MVLIEEVREDEDSVLARPAKVHSEAGAGGHAMREGPAGDARSAAGGAASCSGETGSAGAEPARGTAAPAAARAGGEARDDRSSSGGGGGAGDAQAHTRQADETDSDDDDDDDLPPLENMSMRPTEPRAAAPEAPRSAPAAQRAPPASEAPKAIKRGFFDAKPRARRKPPGASSSSPAERRGGGGGEEVPTIRAKAPGAGGKSIPSFMRVDPSESEVALGKMKEKLVAEMKPTPDMIGSIQGDAALMEGFDDPEVMAAVAEVAKDAAAISKYQNNPKVLRFYRSMAGLMADRFNKKADEQERAQGGA